MSEMVHPITHIVSDPNMLSGQPRIGGTRIAVIHVSQAAQAGWSPERIAGEFSLSLAQVYAALSYYHDHAEEVDRVAREAEAYAFKVLAASNATHDEQTGTYSARVGDWKEGLRPDDFLTTEEAAQALGVTDSRVRQLILDGKLPAEKVGGIWLMRREDVGRAKERPGRGYPKGRRRKGGIR